jgi:hypothetical protein
MKRLFIALVASLVLGLVGGVAPAWADLLPPPSATSVTQTGTQSNDGSNTANQSATSAPVVVSSPNLALANKGDVNQNSGNQVDASTSNTATQSNNQANDAGQTQTVSGGGHDTSQSADQSNTGTNNANQSATSQPVVVSGPNVAAFNSGDVNQNSGNWVDASSTNDANQHNTQSNDAGQSQTVAGHGCCAQRSSDPEQSATQSNDGSNSANQTAESRPVVVSGGNYAIANRGDVNQNSGNWVDASTSNTATQRNHQSNDAGQSQTVRSSGCCSGHSDVSQSADQSNTADNSANQRAYSAPVVVSGPNVAAFNGWTHDSCNPCGHGGTVNQNSGNWVDASSSNSATQSNRQSNDLGQTQTVKSHGSGCCGSGDVSQSASQSNDASNSANQTAESKPVVVSGKNVAFLEHGNVQQNSGNWVDASSSNTATQSNRQSNDLGQTQNVHRGSCCKQDCHPRCEPKRCEPKPCDQRSPARKLEVM